MATYQVSVVFGAEDDSLAAVVAQHIADSLKTFENDSVIQDPRIAFVKFEKGAEDVVSE